MLFVLLACTHHSPTTAGSTPPSTLDSGSVATHDSSAPTGGDLLVPVADVDLPGAPVRFDYQEIDVERGQLVIAHMNDDSVVVVDVADGSTLAEIPGVPTARGIAIGSDYVYVSSSPNLIARIDRSTLALVDTVQTGRAPDGVDYDPDDHIVGVSDQGDGALSLLADDGDGAHTQIPLGNTTGNVRYDPGRGWFWITVEQPGTDQLVAVDPKTSQKKATLDLPGCDGAHGLRLHPDGQSAFVACEGNATLVRVEIDGGATSTGPTTLGPDVLSIDPTNGWLYVAAEAGATSIYDIGQDGVALVGTQDVGANAHTVSADPATDRAFFPLPAGPNGTPILRILQPRAR